MKISVAHTSLVVISTFYLRVENHSHFAIVCGPIVQAL
jgi:hypothetical protein